ncbi:MAG: glycosyltransferase [Acidimicrobiales bacterium]|nr:glycosyltransferase [Acidimicrobiales bacterium]
MTTPATSTEPSVAVLVPCRNEEATVADIVSGFLASLPGCVVYVYDNGSSDATAVRAAEAGAVVRTEELPGKGGVVRRMFAELDADVYVMADGDGTYDPGQASLLVERLVDDGLDMVVGTRAGVRTDAGRAGHALGNRMFNRLYRALFGSGFTDILSGYRAFSRRFVQSFPAVSSGFEIETEMSVHASQLRLPVAEVKVIYGIRPDGSASKLRTVADGTNILRAMLVLLKENRPLAFFGSIAGLFFAAALVLGVPLAVTFAQTGLVPRLPTAVLATGLSLVGLLSGLAGLVLDSLAKGRLEMKRLAYLHHRSQGG